MKDRYKIAGNLHYLDLVNADLFHKFVDLKVTIKYNGI
jgi:hypothetical protein